MTATSAPCLRRGLEIINGMDDLPMIFDPVTGSYHRLSRSARALVDYLDGTRTQDDLVRLLAPTPAERERLLPQVGAFVAGLDKSGLLEGSEAPAAVRRSRVSSTRWMPRIVLTRSLPRLLEPPARLLRRLPLAGLSTVATVLAVVGFVVGAVVLSRLGLPARDRAGAVFLMAVGVQLTLIFVHEAAHALVAQVQRVPVRGLGVALLFYFMPVAYVDRTDAYRLRNRGGRLAIALAGIVADGLTCGITALVAATSDGVVRETAAMLIGLQLVALMVNLNPLMPGDGYTALETASGMVDFRGRAFFLVRSWVRRAPLPVHLASLSRKARIGYATYAVVAASYVLLAGGLVVLGVWHAVLTGLAAGGLR
ncbi:MAG: PqqD family peptide modification chaperone [Nocardioides sp.]